MGFLDYASLHYSNFVLGNCLLTHYSLCMVEIYSSADHSLSYSFDLFSKIRIPFSFSAVALVHDSSPILNIKMSSFSFSPSLGSSFAALLPSTLSVFTTLTISFGFSLGFICDISPEISFNFSNLPVLFSLYLITTQVVAGNLTSSYQEICELGVPFQPDNIGTKVLSRVLRHIIQYSSKTYKLDLIHLLNENISD